MKRLGDKYEKMTGMPRNGENDRLGLSKKHQTMKNQKVKKLI